DNWNAIDPNVVIDERGMPWLSFGSYMSGIQIVKLTLAGSRADSVVRTIASRNGGAIEAPFIVKLNSYYYLFTSWDRCCRGTRSTYNIRVGRSQNALGPYVDKDGKLLTNGGGSIVHANSTRWRGPGHNAILTSNGKIYNVYHAYDASNKGVPTLRISELVLDAQGWPIVTSP
ncbi:MAG: arabinan endo-1,5-alpha-L-arabinosidase, partial [Candidatus Yanofskybacteria bacterium]|nr:arabinan endo-1,5-alpha-L-arabinosidase [Candidatus Yanofskybacteria bacterium]